MIVPTRLREKPFAGMAYSASFDTVVSTLVQVIAHHTGQRISPADLQASLSSDLMMDWSLVGRVAWDAAVELDLRHLSDRLSIRQLQSFRTLAEVTEFLEEDLLVAQSARERIGLLDPERFASLWMPATPRGKLDVAVEDEFPMKVEFISGSPADMGRQYGLQQADSIRRYLEHVERKVATEHNVSTLGLDRLAVMPELQDAVENPTGFFCDDEVEEIQAMAAAADLPWDFVLGHNIGVYPDYVPGCSQFAVTARRNPEFGLIQGYNEDSPGALLMRDQLTRVMTVRRPAGGLPHLTFGLTGQVGGLIGVNSAGLCVSSTLCLDRPRRRETQHGLIQPVVVKRILEAASNIPEALDVLRGCTRNASWGVCISHFPSDRLCYVEYDGRETEISDHVETVLSTNHCRMLPPICEPPAHSISRLKRLQSLLNFESNRGLSPAWAKTILRDRYDLTRSRETPFPTMHTIRRVDNQGSFVFVPAAGELWATAGPMAPNSIDRYFRVSLARLFGTEPANAATRS